MRRRQFLSVDPLARAEFRVTDVAWIYFPKKNEAI